MPVAPNQSPTLIVLLHVWNQTNNCPRYEMQTPKGLVPVETIQKAREYSTQQGYSGIKVNPV